MSKRKLPRRHEVLGVLASREPRALHARELAAELGVREGDYLGFLGLLGDMTLDGVIRSMRGQRYRCGKGSAREAREVREGRIRVHPRGFGFVCTAGAVDDVYVQQDSLSGAMHGDVVRVEVLARSWRGLEGRVQEVLQRANTRVQGVLRKTRHGAWLEVDDARIRGPVVLHGDIEGEDGDAAVVEIDRFPESGDENPEGKLLEALGEPGSLDVETRKVLLRQGIEESFSSEIQLEVSRIAATIDPSNDPSNTTDREDLRDLDLITIDPEDARDRDDAIWVRPLPSGFEAWVAIADVAAYVQPETALDKEALERGFSIYLPDRAVPMLPAELSSDLCSLEQDKDRLCIAAWMKFDERGRRTALQVKEALIRSRATLNYRQVSGAMGWGSAPREALPEPILDQLDGADRLAKLLHRRRMRRGALELSTAEPEILLDRDSGMPIDVVRRATDPGVKRAYRLIEELMIAANEGVATWLQELEGAAIYRVHPPPNETKLHRLAELCGSLEIPFEYEDAADPKRLGAFLRSVQEHPLAEIIGMLTLRSLAPACYDTANVGHFGLASKAYVHFTSPIRRYPDLVIHRLIKGKLLGMQEELEACQDIAMHCTRREREVVDVEREVFDLYRCVMMRDQVGLRAWGVVTDLGMSSVTVTLASPFVEVLIPEGLLGRGGYERSEDGLHLVAKRSGDRISLGNLMEVEVESSDLTRRVIVGKKLDHKKTTGKERIGRVGKGGGEYHSRKPLKRKGKNGKR